MSQVEMLDLVKHGVSLANGGDKAQAREALRQAVELDPGNESAWLWLASVAESAQEALAALERVLSLNPSNEQARSAAHAARLQLGVSAARSGKKPRARALLRLVASAEPNNELAWMWLANVAETPADAAACLERVLAINPDNALARSTLERLRAAAAVRASRGAAPVAPAAAVAAVGDAGRRRVPEKSVLSVDNRSAVRAQMAEMLEPHGYEIRAAADGYEAVDLLRDRGAPDLIVLSASLPGGLDGYQLCKLLRENPTTAHTPILLLSEKAGLFRKMRGGLAGATAELTAPFTPHDLLREVRRLCPVTGRTV